MDPECLELVGHELGAVLERARELAIVQLGADGWADRPEVRPLQAERLRASVAATTAPKDARRLAWHGADAVPLPALHLLLHNVRKGLWRRGSRRRCRTRLTRRLARRLDPPLRLHQPIELRRGRARANRARRVAFSTAGPAGSLNLQLRIFRFGQHRRRRGYQRGRWGRAPPSRHRASRLHLGEGGHCRERGTDSQHASLEIRRRHSCDAGGGGLRTGAGRSLSLAACRRGDRRRIETSDQLAAHPALLSRCRSRLLRGTAVALHTALVGRALPVAPQVRGRGGSQVDLLGTLRVL